jgi:hypothetical protein
MSVDDVWEGDAAVVSILRDGNGKMLSFTVFTIKIFNFQP